MQRARHILYISPLAPKQLSRDVQVEGSLLEMALALTTQLYCGPRTASSM